MDVGVVNRLSEILIGRMQDVNRSGPRQSTGALDAVTASLVELGIADDVGVMELDGSGQFRTLAATSEVVGEADRAQYALREGPCMETSHDVTVTLTSDDVADDRRWPRWGAVAATIGVRAVMSLRLYAAGTASFGALNLYSRSPRTFTTDDLNVARVAASHASVELAHHRNDGHLWTAIDSRLRIGQAQGILMARFELDEVAAFAVLRRLSQTQNLKLAIVADQLVRTGRLPDLAEEDGHPTGS